MKTRIMTGSVLVSLFLFLPLVVQAHTIHDSLFNRADKGQKIDIWFGDHHYTGNYAKGFSVTLQEEDGDIMTNQETGDIWFEAFCVDPEQSAAIGWNVNLDVELVSPDLVEGGLEAAWLMEYSNQYTPTSLDDYQIGALQLALWEVMYDYSPTYEYDVSSGDVRWGSKTGTGKYYQETWDLAQGYLDSLEQYFNPEGLDRLYQIAQHPQKQDLIVKIPDTLVPEPATILLMMVGIAAGLTRLKKKA